MWQKSRCIVILNDWSLSPQNCVMQERKDQNIFVKCCWGTGLKSCLGWFCLTLKYNLKSQVNNLLDELGLSWNLLPCTLAWCYPNDVVLMNNLLQGKFKLCVLGLVTEVVRYYFCSLIGLIHWLSVSWAGWAAPNLSTGWIWLTVPIWCKGKVKWHLNRCAEGRGTGVAQPNPATGGEGGMVQSQPGYAVRLWLPQPLFILNNILPVVHQQGSCSWAGSWGSGSFSTVSWKPASRRLYH